MPIYLLIFKLMFPTGVKYMLFRESARKNIQQFWIIIFTRSTCSNTRPLRFPDFRGTRSFLLSIWRLAWLRSETAERLFSKDWRLGCHGGCVFNEVAIAINNLHSPGLRFAVLDIDAHFGDGTAMQFYDNPDVTFLVFKITAREY